MKWWVENWWTDEVIKCFDTEDECMSWVNAYCEYDGKVWRYNGVRVCVGEY